MTDMVRELDHENSEHDAHLHPIPVHVVKDSAARVEGSQYAGWNTYPLTGTESQPVQILAQDLRRRRAVIVVLPGYSDNNVTGFVLLGDHGQVSNGQGGILLSGNTIVVENGRALWLMNDSKSSGTAHALTVTVLDERYK